MDGEKIIRLKKGSKLEGLAGGSLVVGPGGFKKEIVIDLNENQLTTMIWFNYEVYVLKRKLDSYVVLKTEPVEARKIDFDEENMLYEEYKKMLYYTFPL